MNHGHLLVLTRLKYFKAKIVALQRSKANRIRIDSRDTEFYPSERQLFVTCQARRRSQGKMISRIKIKRIRLTIRKSGPCELWFPRFSVGSRTLRWTVIVWKGCVQVLYANRRATEANNQTQITESELRQAILQGARRKSQGVNGIPVVSLVWMVCNKDEDAENIYCDVLREYITKRRGESCVFRKQNQQRELLTIDRSRYSTRAIRSTEGQWAAGCAKRLRRWCIPINIALVAGKQMPLWISNLHQIGYRIGT